MLKASRERAGTIGFFLLLRMLSLATPSPPRYRAAELKHGRVAMLATCGIAYTVTLTPTLTLPLPLPLPLPLALPLATVCGCIFFSMSSWACLRNSPGEGAG